MAYEKKAPIKTNAEWDKINFKNNLGPQIGGLLHDAVAIVVGIRESRGCTKESVRAMIEETLDMLYDIAEAKKADLLEIKPITHEQAERANKAFGQKKSIKEIEEEEHRANQANEILQQVATEDEPVFNHEEASENQYQAKKQ